MKDLGYVDQLAKLKAFLNSKKSEQWNASAVCSTLVQVVGPLIEVAEHARVALGVQIWAQGETRLHPEERKLKDALEDLDTKISEVIK